MMLLHQIALVSESRSIPYRELAAVSAALQKQATRDLGPIWNVQATVDAFECLEDVPLAYWHILIEDDIHTAGAAGVHEDRMGQPFALVKASEKWSLTASHECIEMLGDPFGRRVVAGFEPTNPGGEELRAGKGKRQSARKKSLQAPRRVEFLVELCDPCEDEEYAYQINGILVSDFYTPQYFAPVASDGERYDFTGKIRRPREVLKNGYLSWHDPMTDEWFQLTNFGGEKIKNLGKLEGHGSNIRAWIDRQTETPGEKQMLAHPKKLRPPSRGALLRDTVQGALGSDTVQGALAPDYFVPSPRGLVLENGGGVQGMRESLRRDADALRKDITRAKQESNG